MRRSVSFRAVDRKVLAVGDVPSGTPSLYVVRYLPTGVIDTTFGEQGVVKIPLATAARSRAIALQPEQSGDRSPLAVRAKVDGLVDERMARGQP